MRQKIKVARQRLVKAKKPTLIQEFAQKSFKTEKLCLSNRSEIPNARPLTANEDYSVSIAGFFNTERSKNTQNKDRKQINHTNSRKLKRASSQVNSAIQIKKNFLKDSRKSFDALTIQTSKSKPFVAMSHRSLKVSGSEKDLKPQKPMMVQQLVLPAITKKVPNLDLNKIRPSSRKK